MAGKEESFSMKPCGTGTMEAEEAVAGEKGALMCSAKGESFPEAVQPARRQREPRGVFLDEAVHHREYGGGGGFRR